MGASPLANVAPPTMSYAVLLFGIACAAIGGELFVRGAVGLCPNARAIADPVIRVQDDPFSRRQAAATATTIGIPPGVPPNLHAFLRGRWQMITAHTLAHENPIGDPQSYRHERIY